MKAIETVYNGYRFRSRLEARWAVFFDALGIEYEYEREGYDLDGVWYLPDFWLPTWQSWVEIKPVYPANQEIEKGRRLVRASEKGCLFIWGEPWASLHHEDGYHTYWDYRYRFAFLNTQRRLPVGEELEPYFDDMWEKTITPDPNFPLDPDDFDLEESHIFTICRRCPALNFLTPGNGTGRSIPDSGKELKPLDDSDTCGFGIIEECCGADKWPVMDLECLPRLQSAYTAARQARFEHGETPRLR